jgi:YegS/Rv2252/BmrU family lipid kinase
MNKTLYIINPAGNGGAGIRVWDTFKNLWNQSIDEKDVIFTERPLHAVEIASSVKEYDIIAAVGGDGTVNEVMEGVYKNISKPCLAIIPAGTGNDIGRSVGIASVEDAVRALKEGQAKKFDLILSESEIGEKYSLLHTNFGFSGTRRTKAWIKKMFGPTIAYYWATFLEILLFRPWDMTLEWDDEKFSGKVTILLIANVEKSAGGSMVIGPGASPTDGKLTVTIVPFKSKYDCLVRKFPKTPIGEIVKEEDVLFFQTDKISIVSNPPTELDIDGDIHSKTPATVRILPRSVDIISPL